MNLVFLAALVAACGAANLDRIYLPPSSSQFAGGAPESLQTPFITTGKNQGLQTAFGRTSDSNPSQGNQLPSGSYENEHQGVVVEAAAPGTRASNQPSGLGGPRENYGSTDSKVGEAAFRETKNQARPNINEAAFQTQAHGSFDNQGTVDINNQDDPDLSAFYQPPGQINTGYRPGNQLLTDRVSNTIKYHMNIGLNKFNYGFETENGIKMQENGVSKDGVETQGGYSYTGDDGKVYTVVYTADKDGYRPMGSHIPTPPPIPIEIQESLQQNAMDEANGIKDDGSYDAQKYNTEDDYTQSDTNNNYNDKQSNKFDERPASNIGTSAVINQEQQAFVRPNVQGQYNSDDYSKDSSSTQPDISKYGSSIGGFHNKGQSHSFGERPGSNTASAVTSSTQQGFIQQNVPEQSSSYGSSSAQTDTSKFGTSISGFENSSNKGNTLAKDEQITQFNNRFGDQFQFSPPPGYFQNANPLLEVDSSKVGFNNNFNNAQPHSEKKYQHHHESIGKPITSLTKPSYCCTSSGQGFSNNQKTPISQISNSFDINGNKNTQNEAFSQTGIQSSLIGSNLGFESSGNAQKSPAVYSDGPFTNFVSSQEVNKNSPQSQGSLPIPNLNFGKISAQNNLNVRPQNLESFSQTATQGSDNKKVENTKPDLINRVSAAFSSQAVPTKQPVLTLTTPLDDQPQKTNSDFSEASFTDIQQQKPYSHNLGNSQSVQTPSVGQFNTFSGQPLGPDDSYAYNKPSNPFNAPTITSPDANKSSGTTSSIFSSVTQPLGSLFPNPSEASVFSVQNQGEDGSSQYPQLPEAPVAPTLATEVVDTGNNRYQSNGITQASISSFPSITPTSSSQLHSEIYEYTKPVQGLPDLSQGKEAGESNSKINQKITLPFPQKEDTITPQVHADSNSQFGQSFSTSSTSSFGQQATPSQFGIQTGTVFGQKPFQPQFGAHGSSEQTSSLFGQKATQQQFGSQSSFLSGQKITPSRFSTQTNSPYFGQKQVLSPFGKQTSTFLNQPLTPTGFGIQTSSSFGQKPSQPQTSFSFGQQTTSSRFGDQTSSSFGQKPTLSSFGAQTTFPFGQAQNQPQTSFSFGQQTTSSRFGDQTSSSFGQKPTLSSFGAQTTSPFDQAQNQPQTSFSFGQQTTPSRFGVQTSSSFRQKPTLTPFGAQNTSPFGQPQTQPQTSFSFGQQTTPSRFGFQTSSKFGQNPTWSQTGGQTSFPFGAQTTSSRFGAQTGPLFGQKPSFPPFGTSLNQQITPSRFVSSFGQQTTPSRFGIQTSSFGQNPSQPQGDGQTSFSFGQTTQSRFETPTSQSFGQQTGSTFGKQTLPTKFGIQCSSTTAQKIAPPSFGVSSTFEKNTTLSKFQESEQQNQSQDSYELSENQNNSRPLTLQLNTLNTQNYLEPNNNTNSDNVYQYNKPTTGFLSNEGNKEQINFGSQQIHSQSGQQSTDSPKKDEIKIDPQITIRPDKQFGSQTELTSADEELSASQETQDGTRLGSQPINESNKQSFSSSLQNDNGSKLNQQSQIPIYSRLSEQSNSSSGDPQIAIHLYSPAASLLGQNYNIKESTSSELSLTSTGNTQYQPSSPSSESSINLQKEGQSQNSQTGEVYQYNKPSQLLPDSSAEENSRFGENIQQEKITEQFGQSKLDTSKPITSHLAQSNEKINKGQLLTQDSDASQTQTDSNPQTATLGTLPSSHPFPQLAFYSACCRGSKPQNNQGSQALSEKIPSNNKPLIGNLGSNSLGFNTNNNKDTNESGLIENKFGSQGSQPVGSVGFGIQKDTPNFNGKGEEFGGPREPPKFDETGYHY